MEDDSPQAALKDVVTGWGKGLQVTNWKLWEQPCCKQEAMARPEPRNAGWAWDPGDSFEAHWEQPLDRRNPTQETSGMAETQYLVLGLYVCV